jgi:hypothetical protein
VSGSRKDSEDEEYFESHVVKKEPISLMEEETAKKLQIEKEEKEAELKKIQTSKKYFDKFMKSKKEDKEISGKKKTTKQL